MKKIIACFFIVGLLNAGAIAQKSAHDVKIRFMQADGRGETALTLDDSSLVKIWSLKDGKLITSMLNGSPEWYTKQVRYKFYNYGRLKTDLTRQFERKWNNMEYYNIEAGGSSVGNIKFPPDAIGSEDFNRNTNKLLLRGITNGKANIWIFDPAVSTTEAKLLDSYKLEGTDFIDPSWSPKGEFIICVHSRKIWNMATGKKINFSKDIKPAGVQPFCFNAEEDKVSITTENGITVLDAKTGKTLAVYAIPDELKIAGPSTVCACADGKSFLYMKMDEIVVKDRTNPLYQKAWLVTEGKVVTELVD